MWYCWLTGYLVLVPVVVAVVVVLEVLAVLAAVVVVVLRVGVWVRPQSRELHP